MRITIDIPNSVYRCLKSRAAREGSSAKKLILRGVEQVLREKPGKSPDKRVKVPVIRSKHPEKLHLDNARIYDVISFP